MAFDKKRLRREIEKDRRDSHRDKVKELRARIQLARLDRKARLSAIRSQCAVARAKLRTNCHARADRAREVAAAEVAGAQSEIREANELDRLIRSGDRRAKKTAVRSTARERRQESDDEVRTNLSPELAPVFERFKRFVKGSPRKSRTEAFYEWAEENPGEVWAFQNEQAEREIREMVREHNRHARAVGAAELDDVPF